MVGHAKPEAQRILSVVEEAQKASVAQVAPGVASGAIDAAARDIIARHGLAKHFTHATGHHVGFRYHDPGFGLAPGQPQLMRPGMIITVEPGVYVKELNAGARIEDNVLVTETGHEVLSQE
jgi:Xaa-Pro aminopeptidase